MKHPFSTLALLLIACLLLGLLIGCASASPPSTALVCPQVPALSPLARQPPKDPTGLCEPTCSAWLSTQLNALLPSATSTAQPAITPSGSTKP